MKIVLAINAFKGSLSSICAAEAAAEGIKKVYHRANIVCVPVGDGGDGTLDALAGIAGAKKVSALVKNPVGKNIRAEYVLFGGKAKKSAAIEMARASGITLIKKLAPLEASTFGVGQLVLDAFKNGAREFIIGLGGSATSDGGLGMLSAVGFEFFDAENKKIKKFGGSSLSDVAEISDSRVPSELKKCKFTLLCDVKNPFFGKNGAAHIYSPQKGATKSQVELLDSGLRSFSKVAEKFCGVKFATREGAGAAGGLGGAFMAFFNAETRSGIDGVLDAVGFSKTLRGADFVLTGEGRLDAQSSMGKAPSGVAKRAAALGIPVIALGGGVADDASPLFSCGVSAMFPVVRAPASLQDAINPANAARNLSLCAENIFRLIKSVSNKK